MKAEDLIYRGSCLHATWSEGEDKVGRLSYDLGTEVSKEGASVLKNAIGELMVRMNPNVPVRLWVTSSWSSKEEPQEVIPDGHSPALINIEEDDTRES